MRQEEFLNILSDYFQNEEGMDALRKGTPLGTDSVDKPVFSQLRDEPFTFRHTCVTGARRTAFIKRLLMTLSCLYLKDEACFFVLSPRLDYGELLRLANIDLTAPFLRTKADLNEALACVKELVSMRLSGGGYPKLFLVLDGLEELPDCNKNGDFEEYRAFFDVLSRRQNIEVITGAELMRSIFSGYPGAFVGVGNCLVTTQDDGVADVTYVGDDSQMSLPTVLHFPSAPSITETVIYLNSVAAAKTEGEV